MGGVSRLVATQICAVAAVTGAAVASGCIVVIEFGEFIGAGSFGRLYRGRWVHRMTHAASAALCYSEWHSCSGPLS
jgi:hypothetical protein